MKLGGFPAPFQIPAALQNTRAPRLPQAEKFSENAALVHITPEFLRIAEATNFNRAKEMTDPGGRGWGIIAIRSTLMYSVAMICSSSCWRWLLWLFKILLNQHKNLGKVTTSAKKKVAYSAVSPPSMTKIDPVAKAESSEAK